MLRLVGNVSGLASSDAGKESLYSLIGTELAGLLGCDRVAVLTFDESGREVIPLCVTPTNTGESPLTPVPLGRSGLDRMLAYRKTSVEEIPAGHPVAELDAALAGEHIHSIIRTPLIAGSNVVGCIVGYDLGAHRFDETSQMIIEQMAAQIAPLIELDRTRIENRDYLEELRIIDEIGDLLMGSLRIEDFYGQLAAELRRLVEFDRISIALYDEDTNTGSAEYSTSFSAGGLKRGDRWPIENTGFGWVLENRVTLVENHLAESRLFDSDTKLFDVGMRSIIRVPVITRERVIAMLALASEKPGNFGPRERRVLERLSAHVAPAIQNARLYWEARERARELEVIDEVSSVLTSSLHINEVYALFAAEVNKIVPFGRMTVLLMEEASDQVIRAYVAGIDPPFLRAKRQFLAEGSPIQEIVNSRRSMMEPDLYSRDISQFPAYGDLARAGLRSGLRVPLVTKQRAIGVLALWSKELNSYGIREQRILERLAAQIAPAIENARLHEEVELALDSVRSAQEKLIRVERLRAMGELASGVAHDLNNSLAAILGRTQLLLSQTNVGPDVGSLEVVEQAAKDSAQVVRRILDFARYEPEPELSGVDVKSVVENVIELTRHRWADVAQSRGHRVEITRDLGDVLPVLASKPELTEVLINLVINACEAIPADGEIRISTANDGDMVCISISDNGVGMSQDVVDKAFEPFYTTKGAKGTGLGLSIVNGIISRFNGRIEINSVEGDGTTVRISIPTTTKVDEPQEQEMADVLQPSRTARILVIEDETVIRETLSDMLAVGGHQVTLAENGEEGIRLFDENRFDIVFTDLGMPGMSGWEVAKLIMDKGGNVPVIMVTGWGIGIGQAEMEAGSVREILPKPFDIDYVLDLVLRMIGENE